ARSESAAHRTSQYRTFSRGKSHMQPRSDKGAEMVVVVHSQSGDYVKCFEVLVCVFSVYARDDLCPVKGELPEDLIEFIVLEAGSGFDVVVGIPQDGLENKIPVKGGLFPVVNGTSKFGFFVMV